MLSSPLPRGPAPAIRFALLVTALGAVGCGAPSGASTPAVESTAGTGTPGPSVAPLPIPPARAWTAKAGDTWTLPIGATITSFAYGSGVIAVGTTGMTSWKLDLIDDRTGQVRAKIDASSNGVYTPAFSPSGDRLAYILKVADNPSDLQDLVLYDLATGHRTRASLGRTAWNLVELTFSHDGSALFAVVDRMRVVRFSVANGLARTGEVEAFASVPPYPVWFPTSDGGLLLFDGKDKLVKLDAALGRTELPFPGTPVGPYETPKLLRAEPELLYARDHHLWVAKSEGTPVDLGLAEVYHPIAPFADAALVAGWPPGGSKTELEILGADSATPRLSIPITFDDHEGGDLIEATAAHVRPDGRAVAFEDTSDSKSLHVVALPETLAASGGAR